MKDEQLWEQARKMKEDVRSEIKCQVSASNSTDLLSAVGLTRIQETKLRYLIEKGGNLSAATVHVGMPDGSLAAVDPFGRVALCGPPIKN